MLGSSLSWAAVAEKVGSRTEKQCRAKWLNQLSWKERGGQEWCKSDDLMLVKKLKEYVCPAAILYVNFLVCILNISAYNG